MSKHLHIWLGNPKSADELSDLLSRLSGRVTKIGEFDVIFQMEESAIEHLADGFSEYRGVKEKIVAAAKNIGIEKAHALIGVKDFGKVGWPFSPPGLTDLGSFELEEDDDSVARS